MADIEANGTRTVGPTTTHPATFGSRTAAGRGYHPIGNPSGLGMLAFATTLFVLSLYSLNARHVNSVDGVLGLSLFTGGLATFMAGMWHFPRGNGYGGAVFTLYGSFWMSFGLFLIPGTGIMASYTESQFRSALGIYFMAWMMLTVILGIASVRRHITWILFYAFLTMTFVLMGASNFSSERANSLAKAGGAFGLITSLIAFYHGLSKLLVGDSAPFGLPLGRMGRVQGASYEQQRY